tara:strand:+ start:240 stop:494 length:255 start_codon:yes stop_codon:yes gene_type:complete
MHVFILLKVPRNSGSNLNEVEILGAWNSEKEATINRSNAINDSVRKWMEERRENTIAAFWIGMIAKRYEVREVKVNLSKNMFIK